MHSMYNFILCSPSIRPGDGKSDGSAGNFDQQVGKRDHLKMSCSLSETKNSLVIE